MKKIITSLILSLVFLIVVVGSFNHVSASSSKLFLDGKQLQTDVSPILKNSITLVPIAVISEGLGQQVYWDGVNRIVTIASPDVVIQLFIDSDIAQINKANHKMPGAAIITSGRTMVPVRFVSETLGLKVVWNDVTRDINIYSDPELELEPSPSPSITPSPTPTVTPSPTPTVTPSPVPGPTPSPIPDPTPLVKKTNALIEEVRLDANQSIEVGYSGELSQPKVQELTEPRRLIVDIPNADYNEAIYKSFVNGQVQIEVNDNTQYNKYRYALFNNNPLTARIVVELSDEATYQLKHVKGKLSIVFGSLVNTNEPTVPKLLVYKDDIINETPEHVYHIALDPGHGGSDPGAVNKVLGIYEKTFTLSFGLKLRSELEKYSRIKVHMTRTDDTYLTLDERVQFAESLPGLNERADMFISIHANSFTKPEINGVETYYYHENSKSLVESIHPAVLKAMEINDRNMRFGNFKVIRDSLMPGILMEVGYLSHTSDAEKLFDDTRQEQLAILVADAIASYLQLK